MKYRKIRTNTICHLAQDFAGNTDPDTVVYNDLNPPIRARYIRFQPVSWYDWITMRVELYGCQGIVGRFSFDKFNSN